MPFLEIHKVVKQFGNYRANDEVSFDVEQGSLFGLLGPNGAGKTTLIRIITAITRPDTGFVKLGGQIIDDKLASVIGYMPEERGLYKKMKVGDHLIYLAQLKGMSRSDAIQAIKSWFDKFEISDWRNKKVEELSKGMQQKIQFIATIIHKPSLLILDEPFSGLDPVNANLIKDEIYELNKQGSTIIFSTHRMEQVEEICKEIVLVNKGKIILNGVVGDIKEQFKDHKYLLRVNGDSVQNHMPDAFITENHGSDGIIIKATGDVSASMFLKDVINQGHEIREFREILPTLNEIFIKKVTEREKI